MLYGKSVRATVPHGRIRASIRSGAGAARCAPRITGEDIRKLIRSPMTPRFSRPADLALDKVRYVGEPVAARAGERSTWSNQGRAADLRRI